ncbi:MAG: hypothetical protein U5L95_01260 [Candidatus Saccharibacteria bacterium]|nr:hypothetical protein [Candidatus Saccharibacteria bacterium]
MSEHTAEAGAPELPKRHKGGLLTIFLSFIALSAAGIATLLTRKPGVTEGSSDAEARISEFGGSAVGGLLALPVVVIAFFFGGLTVLMAAFRLRHFKASKKALFNVIAIGLSVWAIVVALEVFQYIR